MKRRAVLSSLPLAVAGLFVAASLATAHDTWLRAESGVAAVGSVVTFHLSSGEGFAADDFAIDRSRLRVASVRLGHSTLPLVAVPRADTSRVGALLLRATLRTSGVATAWIDLAPRALALDSAKQVEYLDDIHATEAVLARWRSTPAPHLWRETYVKHAKSFVRVGQASPLESSWSTPVGVAVEIIPERDPTTLRAGDQLTVRVLRRGRPFGGMPLGAVHDGETQGEWHTTDARGRATFTIARAGEWMLHGTDLRPVARADREWESDFTTLTVHVRP